MARVRPNARRILGWVVVVGAAVWYAQATFATREVSGAAAPVYLEAWRYKEPRLLHTGDAGEIEYDLRDAGRHPLVLQRFELGRFAGLRPVSVKSLADGKEAPVEGRKLDPGGGVRVIARFTVNDSFVYYPSRIYLEYREGLRTLKQTIEVKYP